MTATQRGCDPLDRETAAGLVCELLRSFYALGWCTGTGGGLSVKIRDGYLMAPSGVAKERVEPDELFLLDSDFRVQNETELVARGLRLSECAPLFESIYRRQGAGAVIHTHGIPVVLATRRARDQDELAWERLEMIKGIRGASYPERHSIPLIENAPRECALKDSLEVALERLPPHAHAVAVRDHGAYVWGADAMEAKRHAEVYHWLCQFEQAESGRGS